MPSWDMMEIIRRLEMEPNSIARFFAYSTLKMDKNSTFDARDATVLLPESVIIGADIFISEDITGTGSPIATAHGLPEDPTTDNVFLTIIDSSAYSNPAFTSLSTDATNVTVTVNNGIVYRILALVK